MPSANQSLQSLLPARIRERLEPPDRARNDKINSRYTHEEFEILQRLSQERGETVTAVVRKLALAAIPSR